MEPRKVWQVKHEPGGRIGLYHAELIGNHGKSGWRTYRDDDGDIFKEQGPTWHYSPEEAVETFLKGWVTIYGYTGGRKGHATWQDPEVIMSFIAQAGALLCRLRKIEV